MIIWRREFNYEDHIGLWERELSEFVPDKLFDSHVHVGTAMSRGPRSEDELKTFYGDYCPVQWDDLTELYQHVFRGKEVKYTCGFGFPHWNEDVRKANEYVLQTAKKDKRLLPFLLPSYTEPCALIDDWKKAEQLGVEVKGVKLIPTLSKKPVVEPPSAFNVNYDEFCTPDGGADKILD